MKLKTSIAIVCMAMFALTACNEDDRPPKGETASFFIQIENPDNMSRVTGGDMSTQSVEFTDGYLIFTTGNEIGKVVVITDSPGVSEVEVGDLILGTTITGVPASTTNVYLYGNLGSSLGTIGNVAIVDGSITNVETLTWILADIQNDENTVAKVPVYGKGDVAPGTSDPDRLESTFPVGPIASRLQIGTISCTDADVTKLELAGIYINGFYHTMYANSTFEATNMVDHGIDVNQYSETGYTAYSTMKDIISPEIDLGTGDATPGADLFWAYNFFPAEMPHIVLHFATIEATGGVSASNKYATVAKYSTTGDGDPTKMVETAEAAKVYSLNIVITDYETQITDLPESDSEVIGHVKISMVNWTGVGLYPEW